MTPRKTTGMLTTVTPKKSAQRKKIPSPKKAKKPASRVQAARGPAQVAPARVVKQSSSKHQIRFPSVSSDVPTELNSDADVPPPAPAQLAAQASMWTAVRGAEEAAAQAAAREEANRKHQQIVFHTSLVQMYREKTYVDSQWALANTLGALESSSSSSSSGSSTSGTERGGSAAPSDRSLTPQPTFVQGSSRAQPGFNFREDERTPEPEFVVPDRERTPQPGFSQGPSRHLKPYVLITTTPQSIRSRGKR